MSAVAPLFQPLKVGNAQLSHRLMMAAMTRLRNDPETEAPRELNVEYYTQRSSPGGLLLSEAANVSAMGKGYVRAPNLYDVANINGWKKVTTAVHDKGALIFAQLFHAGRVTHSSLLPGGTQPLAPSAVKMAGQLYVAGGVKADYEEPRAMAESDIRQTVQEFVHAAERALEAGFDGVELHGGFHWNAVPPDGWFWGLLWAASCAAGNGYLLQEFLAQPTNRRDDDYGGSVENRSRFVLELVDACVAAVGAQRVAIKLQPGVTFSDLVETEEDSRAQLAYLGPQLAARGIAFVELSSLNDEPYFRFVGLDAPNFKQDIFKFFRQHYTGTLAINGGLTPEKAAEYVADGTANFASFGVPYVANANLPELVRAGVQLNPAGANPAVWYSKDPASDAHGYTDWPLVKPVEA